MPARSVNPTFADRVRRTTITKMKLEDLVTVAEAAEIAGCCEPTIRKKVRNGELEGERIGARVWMVSRSAAEKLAKTISNRSLRKRAEAAASKAKAKRSARA